MLGIQGLCGRSKGVHSNACWDRRAGRFRACRSSRRTAARGRSSTRDPSVHLLRVMLFLTSRSIAQMFCFVHLNVLPVTSSLVLRNHLREVFLEGALS